MNTQNNPADKAIYENIFLKTLGYLLLLTGITTILYVIYQLWSLFHNPGQVSQFASALTINSGDSIEIPLSILNIAAWQIVIVILLTAGKVSVWLIETGQGLIKALK